MQERQGIFQIFFFAVFFSVGAAALGGAVLCDDLVRYCHNRDVVAEAQDSIERLQSLNAEYDALLGQLESDPDLVKRLAPVTLGIERNEPNTAYPRARAAELATARQALIDDAEHADMTPALPRWLQRCSDPTKRIALFIAGAGLVLISLACFSSNETEQK
jgi:hypothetical protein